MKNISLSLFFLLSVSTTIAQTVHVEVDAARPVRPINPWLYGINTANWDESLFPGRSGEILLTSDRDAIAKIKASGTTLLKYPGGNQADRYVWNSPDNPATEMDTDEYIAFCRETGAEPFITINFNESPELAADWVQYCNLQRGYGVKLWEVGDEQWGWWAKGHAPPEEYAKKYISFVKAMKSVDPTIKVATNVPLGSHPENWTERVLRAAGEYVDMLTYTYFPQNGGKENDDSLFATTSSFRALHQQLVDEVERVVGPEKAKQLLTINVGYNSVNTGPGPQTIQLVNALWVADMLGTMAELGTDIGCLWALHNQYPPRGGDFGYLSSDGRNTPRFTYFVFPMFVNLFGSEVLRVTGANGPVSVYASRTGKTLTLALINKQRRATIPVEIALSHFNPHPKAEAWILDEKRQNERLPDLSIPAAQFDVKVPPYALMMVRLLERDSLLPSPNLARGAIATASSFSPLNALWGPGTFTPSSAIDGNTDTRWRAGVKMTKDEADPDWLQLSWKRSEEIGLVRILWGENHGTDYQLQVSQDGTTWRAIREVRGGTGGVEHHEIVPPVKTRFLRFKGVKGTTGPRGGSPYAIRELEVFSPRP
ncbi:MAG: discoidin domain-containing protein [Ignavibacteriales bacterium]|nr:discoidin domain-containing protein [Ignavibacteriales bacterium]